VYSDNSAMDVVSVAISAVIKHPSVTNVSLAGSRSRGTHDALSDWDFAVETVDFQSVVRDLPALVDDMHPLAAQWEPLGHFPVYMLLLKGPTKVEYLFLEHSQVPLQPLRPDRTTLSVIDAHFWDWIWWLTTKAAIGRDDLVAQHLSQLHRHLLMPLGVYSMAKGIEEAVRMYLHRRKQLEGHYGVTLPRALEEEVREGMRRLGYAT
jgi:hypothetical protein